jgi:hypothetical protein
MTAVAFIAVVHRSLLDRSLLSPLQSLPNPSHAAERTSKCPRRPARSFSYVGSNFAFGVATNGDMVFIGRPRAPATWEVSGGGT